MFIYLLAFDEYRTRWAIIAVPRILQPILSVFNVVFLLPSGKVSMLVLLAVLAIPGFVIKQIINVVQLRTAAEELVAYDLRNAAPGAGVDTDNNTKGHIKHSSTNTGVVPSVVESTRSRRGRSASTLRVRSSSRQRTKN